MAYLHFGYKIPLALGTVGGLASIAELMLS
jgi:hypothetical protein